MWGDRFAGFDLALSSVVEIIGPHSVHRTEGVFKATHELGKVVWALGFSTGSVNVFNGETSREKSADPELVDFEYYPAEHTLEEALKPLKAEHSTSKILNCL